ncbi:YifB family Mg chelatase-like AAA ATPase [Cryptosporangium aurantiacum]|uniref:Magnesium chelatase family protein n=1 Tax=Cryptosporangium aurantiacum TaxID=134849 RepID=A0A1M7HX56_9ACTN|nr:YifB family Mg chelatase-like AAA ATPase [Cryptosporangium aurantiacum]SHM33065.1 magnesium chelatase family protein [Cryptosporangium aurantiacum]
MAGFARALAVGLHGVHGWVVEVEAHLAQGLPGLVITGLPDAAVSQARDRVRAAVLNSGQRWPDQRITVGLGPAWLPKHGTNFDLAVAAAILVASGAAPAVALDGLGFLGELGLDGRIRPVRGVFPAVAAGAKVGLLRYVVPAGNWSEAALVPGADVVGRRTLRGVLALLRGEEPPLDDAASAPQARAFPDSLLAPGGDLADVVGQELGRRAVEVAAAGGHHLALFGPPGAGKTMLAERLPGILPTLDDEAAVEVTAVHSVAGVLPAGGGLVRQPPYQAPHHTATVAALVGGGSGLARPGAVTLAHRGVLFLDETPEFSPRALDALRQPVERGEVVLARTGGAVRYPACVQLVLAANPCPCATAAGDRACTCTPTARRRYLGRISGPLLDRIDVRVLLLPVASAALFAGFDRPDPTSVVAARVRDARAAARERWEEFGWVSNAAVPGPALRAEWRLPRSVTTAAARAVDTGELSARGYDRVLRIAWTISDLSGRMAPDQGDVNEALELRRGLVAA